MNRLVNVVVVIAVLGLGMVSLQGLGQPVHAAQLPTVQEFHVATNSEMTTVSPLEGETALHPLSCNGNACLDQSNTPHDVISEIQVAPQQPAELPKANLPSQIEISTLPAYLNKFLYSWSPARSGGCSEVWNINTPQIAGHRWLTTPVAADGLKTTTNFYILAGMLIRNNLVNASQCAAGGLADVTGSNLAANNCGVDLAYQTVTAWQNQFDKRIYEVSNTTQIPATLIKNFIRQESQFWPAAFSANGEVGLGQMTSAGADTLLRWSPDLFKDLCKVSFTDSACDKGYSHLTSGEQAALQGSILQVVNATCPDCTNGINGQQANFSVGVFSEALLANCRQVDQVVRDVSKVKTSNLVSTYADLWKITLFNYNAGSGCTERAITRTWKQNPGEVLTWNRVQSNIDMDCLGGIKYVDGITK